MINSLNLHEYVQCLTRVNVDEDSAVYRIDDKNIDTNRIIELVDDAMLSNINCRVRQHRYSTAESTTLLYSYDVDYIVGMHCFITEQVTIHLDCALEPAYIETYITKGSK